MVNLLWLRFVKLKVEQRNAINSLCQSMCVRIIFVPQLKVITAFKLDVSSSLVNEQINEKKYDKNSIFYFCPKFL